jgi:hypothetical protein
MLLMKVQIEASKFHTIKKWERLFKFSGFNSSEFALCGPARHDTL